MHKNIKLKWFTLLLIACTCFAESIQAQLSVIPQIRTRTEFRNGVGNPRPLHYDPAFFTSQRSRLSVQYKNDRLIMRTSIQDVRVWGQDASTISAADGNKLSMHEAWAELMLSQRTFDSSKTFTPYSFAVKIGRQELLYDDSRLLGNLDWLQQGRRHDALLLKFLYGGWQADAGFAFNQHTDNFNYNGTFYTPANVQPFVKDSKGNLVATPASFIPTINAKGWSAKTGSPALQNAPGTNAINQLYKSLQFLYLSKQTGTTKISALLLSDQFARSGTDSVLNISGTDTGYVYGRKYNLKGVNTRFTAGLYVNGTPFQMKQLLLKSGIYLQGGKDRDGNTLKAWSSTISLSWLAKNWIFTGGWDYLSGNQPGENVINNRFDPLYGTPHLYWGAMDYFYVGTGSPAAGLSNPFAKLAYTTGNKKIRAGIDYHYFATASKIADQYGNQLNNYIGSEVDLSLQYVLNKYAVIDFGCSYLWASPSMEYAKGIPPGTTRSQNTWCYLQINIKPEFLFK